MTEYFKDPERCKVCSREPEMCAYCDNRIRAKSAASVTEDALKQLVFQIIENNAEGVKHNERKGE